jgi:hypothetical protein
MSQTLECFCSHQRLHVLFPPLVTALAMSLKTSLVKRCGFDFRNLVSSPISWEAIPARRRLKYATNNSKVIRGSWKRVVKQLEQGITTIAKFLDRGGSP